MKNYCHIWNQHSRYFQHAKFRTKIEILKFWIKNALFWYFGVKFWNIVVIFDISTLKLVKSKELYQNKNPYIRDQKSLIWVFLSCNLKKLLLFLKSALSNLLINKVLCKKKETSNVEPKIPYLGIFGLRFWKTIVTFGIGTLEIVKMESFVPK